MRAHLLGGNFSRQRVFPRVSFPVVSCSTVSVLGNDTQGRLLSNKLTLERARSQNWRPRSMILQTYTAALNNSTGEDQEPASEGASSLLSRDRTSSSSDVAMADEDASAPLLRSSTQGRRFPEWLEILKTTFKVGNTNNRACIGKLAINYFR